MTLINRIPESTLSDNPYVNGQVLYGENLNYFVKTAKEGINQNYYDIQRIFQGGTKVITAPDGSFTYIRLNADNAFDVSKDGVTWTTTAQGGHIILNSGGSELPQRARMQFKNVVVSDVDGITVIEGITGPQGPQGAQGIQGSQGTQGAVGPTGPQGNSGVKGETGATGLTGPQGPQGLKGVDGLQGEQGPRGLQGAIGVTGATGPTGPQGLQGPQGIKGDKGESGEDFVVRGLFPTYTALTTTYPVGQLGWAYAVGNALTNVIYLWDTTQNSWVSLGSLQGPQGPQGVAGPQGPTGPVGATGPEGPAGMQGPAGIQGLQGPQGIKGDAGSIGPAGPTGATGPTGPAGPQGIQGIAGPQGVAGPLGPEGPQGPIGPTGLGVPIGGSVNQILKKTSASNYVTGWGYVAWDEIINKPALYTKSESDARFAPTGFGLGQNAVYTANINDVKVGGWCAGDPNCVGAPFSSWWGFTTHTAADGNYTMQDAWGLSTRQTFTRFNVGGNWEGWVPKARAIYKGTSFVAPGGWYDGDLFLVYS